MFDLRPLGLFVVVTNPIIIRCRLFGPKVISLKPIVKVLPKLLEDRDKTVREETKMLVVEVFRWIGAALRPQLANLKPLQVIY